MTLFNSKVKYLFLIILFSGTVIQSFPNNTIKFDASINKALSFKNKKSDSLFYYANLAYNLANNPNQKLDVLIVMIEANIRSGDVLNALVLCDSIESIAKMDNLFHREPDILLNLGNVYLAMGFLAESLDYFFKGLKSPYTKTQINNRIDLYYYISLANYGLGEYVEARKYANLSLQDANDYKLKNKTLPSYLLLANTFNNLDSIQKYLDLAKQTIDNNEELLYEKSVILNRQALLNKSIGNYSLSKIQYIEAINISLVNGFKKNLSTIYNNYSYLLMAESKYDSAKYYLNLALEISININSLYMESEIYDSYSDYYERTGDFENALLYTNLFIEKRDQFRQQQQIQKSLFLSAVFETEQKEKEILKQENKINRRDILILSILAVLAIAIGFAIYFIQRNKLNKSRIITIEKEQSLEIADTVIQSQDSERKRLAMDLHDGLGARLGALRFMVDSEFYSNKSYNKVIDSIVGIHENMRSISHRMQPPELEKRGLSPAIENLISTVNQSGKFEIDFEYDIEFKLSKKLETNIYFLVYELVNNAIKHSNGNSIFVQLLEHKNEISLSVEDNGTSFHYDESMAGMGMNNIQTRVKYLNGNISIESTGNDTSIMIEIPI